MSALTVQELFKRYGDVRVLDGVSLEVAPGSTTAILGPSGCGKTTLLRLVAGFDRADAGTILLNGKEVSSNRRALPPDKRNIGYVAQEGALFPHLTVRGNVAFGLGKASERRGRVDELLELVSLDGSVASRYPHELSGGQQQRVALARALAPRPTLVLLDEPFSSLDTALRAATRQAVSDALQAEGVTTVLVTHDQTEALSLSDQVAVMANGTFTQVGTPETLYTDPADLDTALLLGPGSSLAGKVSGEVAHCPLGTLRLVRPFPDGDAAIFVRPEQLEVTRAAASDDDVRGIVQASAYVGPETMVTVDLADGSVVEARVAGAVRFAAGDHVTVTVHGPVHAYPPASEGSIISF